MFIFKDDMLNYYTLIGDLTVIGVVCREDEYKVNNFQIFFRMSKIFQLIDDRKWKYCEKHFKLLNDEEKSVYNYDEANFRKKYATLAKIETFYNMVIYVNKNIENLYPITFTNENTFPKFKKCLNIFQNRIEYILKEVRKLDFYLTENEKDRMNKIEKMMENLLWKIKDRRKKQSLLFHLPFYKGDAEIINIDGIKQEIMDFIY